MMNVNSGNGNNGNSNTNSNKDCASSSSREASIEEENKRVNVANVANGSDKEADKDEIAGSVNERHVESSNVEEQEEHEEEGDVNKDSIHEIFNQMYNRREISYGNGNGLHSYDNVDDARTSRFSNIKGKIIKGNKTKQQNSGRTTYEYSPSDSAHVNNASHKIVGLGDAAKKVSQEKNYTPSTFPLLQSNRPKQAQIIQQQRQEKPDLNPSNQPSPVGVKFSVKEKGIRLKADQNKTSRFIKSNVAAVLVFYFYLLKMESLLSCTLTVGLTLYWYFYAVSTNNSTGIDWSGSGIDWVVLGFAVVTPVTVSIGMAFRRRELALFHISRVRSFSFQFYLAHAVWDWDGGQGRDRAKSHMKNSNIEQQPEEIKMNWLGHTDQVLEHLIGMGDELSRFLTLPTSSRTYHRMLQSGREEAAEIVEVQYRLFDSLYTRRVIKLTQLTEVLKSKGLSATEGSRLRQYERYIGESIEGLRMIKMYRTPQALRAFGRFFTLLLPPLYAASFSSLAIEMQSLAIGILFAVITPLCLTALFESMTNLEDPFVGWTTLDGIDVAEELEVLHWHQLKNARNEIYPNARPFSLVRDETLSETTFQPRDGDIFDLRLIDINDSSGEMRMSSGSSRYALDTSIKRRISEENAGMDGSGRVSHYAMDASVDSHRRGVMRNISNSSKHRRNMILEGA